MLANSLFRLGYGAGALIRPRAMATAGLAPETETSPEARLFVRGFGVHQIAVAAVALGSIRRRTLEPPAIALAMAIGAADMVSAAVEATARGRMDGDLGGGLLFSAAGVVTAYAALRARD